MLTLVAYTTLYACVCMCVCTYVQYICLYRNLFKLININTFVHRLISKARESVIREAISDSTHNETHRVPSPNLPPRASLNEPMVPSRVNDSSKVTVTSQVKEVMSPVVEKQNSGHQIRQQRSPDNDDGMCT